MKHNRFDILTDINLKHIKKENNWVSYYHFINEDGKRLADEYSEIDSKSLVNYMHYDYGLITYPSDGGDICQLTKKGFEVIENGGWLKVLENNLKLEQAKIEKQTERENIKDKIDLLTAENLEYQNSKIELEKQIQNLTRDNLRLNNWDIRFRWLIAIGTFIAGIITHYLLISK